MISVELISYNGEKYIRRQLESILNQLPEDGEVVVSDDGSTDSTRDIVFRSSYCCTGDMGIMCQILTKIIYG